MRRASYPGLLAGTLSVGRGTVFWSFRLDCEEGEAEKAEEVGEVGRIELECGVGFRCDASSTGLFHLWCLVAMGCLKGNWTVEMKE